MDPPARTKEACGVRLFSAIGFVGTSLLSAGATAQLDVLQSDRSAGCIAREGEVRTMFAPTYFVVRSHLLSAGAMARLDVLRTREDDARVSLDSL
jgi:hypothetical protein